MEDYFKLLHSIGYKRFFNKDEILFFEGESPKKLFVLLSGKVRIYKSTKLAENLAPREKTLHYISAPNFIAEMPSLLKQPFPASAISTRSKFMPLCFLILLLSGGAMLSRYINSEVGYFETQLQQFLMIKTILALGIGVMIAISLTFFYVLKKPSPFRKIIHPVALGIGILIVILAKLAFY